MLATSDASARGCQVLPASGRPALDEGKAWLGSKKRAAAAILNIIRTAHPCSSVLHRERAIVARLARLLRFGLSHFRKWL